LNLVS